jgi:predicted SprT family Zn-dependent metalloprotease
MKHSNKCKKCKSELDIIKVHHTDKHKEFLIYCAKCNRNFVVKENKEN